MDSNFVIGDWAGAGDELLANALALFPMTVANASLPFITGGEGFDLAAV